ncbi:MAG: glycosyl transferase, partial [Nitrospira sp. WS238]|nr:glycosyl transferase [Nitrospira sp. WS238]
DQHHALMQQSEEAGLRHTVHLLGHREDIEVCLAGFDCFVLPSLNEGMGRALIEAMAAGLPVVASRVGGIPALIKDGQNGLLVPPGNSSALAGALRRILYDPTWANDLGLHASRSIGPDYGIQAMVDAIEAIYKNAVAGHA